MEADSSTEEAMKEQQIYPEYIGVSDVTIRSFDLTREVAKI